MLSLATFCFCGPNSFLILQVSNAYLQMVYGASTKILLEFIKEMPKPGTRLSIDISSLLSGQFFTYVIIALFPVSMHDFVGAPFSNI